MKISIVAVVAASLVACSEPKAPQAELPKAAVAKPAAVATPTISEITSPAGANAAEPFLFATRDGVLLSWLESPADHRAVLRFARYRNGHWSAPGTIVDGGDLFVNWADFPSIAEDANGVLYVQWLQKHGRGAESYDVRMAVSKDGGSTWGKSFLLNRDGREAEHGFVTLAALPPVGARGSATAAQGGMAATWLDGRNIPNGEGSGDMTLRYATIDANGTITGDTEVDKRTCECCTTGMTMASSGPVIVYRDRSADEIRDISCVHADASGWSQPRLVHADNWKINGCPVNGPQIDGIGEHLATAWFTSANGQPRVCAAFSNDGGKTFAAAIVIDDAKPLGRVDIVMLDEKSAVVSWLAETSGGGEIRARRIAQNDAPAAPLKIAATATARSAGFPRMARSGNEVWFAWTEHGADGNKVRVAKAAF